ncbi:hypothetical protein GN244_ATG04582 [Phytophthora infestans]|uniref:Uncharacterized protein n=1 Tax=Phytophthora infestans TaxID=4787 RepID=A0A833S953_PHYIN|nr:hypothetical protein GN244_ATG04582 [Phytophthora infestans]
MQTTTLSVRSSKTGAGLMPSTRTNSSMTSLARPPLKYLRKILLYSLLCLIAKTLAANPCFRFAIQYCQLRTHNALTLFAKWSLPSEARFFSFI